MNDTLALATGLAAALGGGLLIGLERERRKGRGAQRRAAGIRSFALAALGGGIAQALAQPALVALGAALVGGLAAVAYFASRRPPDHGQRGLGQPPADPGLTTELALFITYLVGVLSVQQPALGAGAAVVVAALLAGRERLHRFATQALSEAELHDALLLAALSLVLLPLAPAAPVAWLGGLVPRTVLLVMVLILALQGAGHVAGRLWGARTGLALSGLFSGFVSSTATIASMGTRWRAEPAQRASCEAGALLSTTATWLQALLLLAATAPPAALALLPSAAAGAAVAAAAGLARMRAAAAQTAHEAPTPASARATARGSSPRSARGPLRVPEAMLVAGLLAGVTLVVGWAERHYGSAGLLAGTALGALADAHAPVAALGALHAAGAIETAAVRDGALVAVAANSCTRSVTAFVAGGFGYGVRMTAVLATSSAAALAVALALR